MFDTNPFPSGPAVAFVGLRDAASRLDTASSTYLSRGEGAVAVAAAMSEAIYWVDTLDEYARERGPMADYVARRLADHGGNAVGGLVYARNFHTHELLTAGEEAYQLASVRPILHPDVAWPPPRRGPWLIIRLRWTSLAGLPKKPDKNQRDQMYAAAVERRPLSEPIHKAIDWLNGLAW